MAVVSPPRPKTESPASPFPADKLAEAIDALRCIRSGPHDEHLEADRATYNVHADSGKFHDVRGTTGASFRGKQVILTSSNP